MNELNKAPTPPSSLGLGSDLGGPSSPGAPTPSGSGLSGGGGGDAKFVSDLSRRLQEAARQLESEFLGKEEIIRLLFVSAIAGEHMVMVGPPGTAKSALVRAFSEVVEADYYDYLLTRFTEPNEIFGPVDIQAFRQGRYERRIEGMLPTAEIAFLDEIFKANSAILNSLLTLLNARTFTHGNKKVEVPLLSLFAASNEVPGDEALSALFDRFLLRVNVGYLDSYHFRGLLQKGAALEAKAIARTAPRKPAVKAAELRRLQAGFGPMLARLPEEFLTTYKALVFQVRSEGIGLSDRRAVKMLKLFVASAVFDGRDGVTDADFFVLRHVWNTPEQEEVLQEIVGPILDRHYEQNPQSRRVGAAPANLQDLLEELRMIREALSGSGVLSDMQLFSQLRNLGDIKSALERMSGNTTAERMVTEVDKLLETVFASSRFV